MYRKPFAAKTETSEDQYSKIAIGKLSSLSAFLSPVATLMRLLGLWCQSPSSRVTKLLWKTYVWGVIGISWLCALMNIVTICLPDDSFLGQLGGIAYGSPIFDKITTASVHVQWALNSILFYRYRAYSPLNRRFVGAWAHLKQNYREYVLKAEETVFRCQKRILCFFLTVLLISSVYDMFRAVEKFNKFSQVVDSRIASILAAAVFMFSFYTYSTWLICMAVFAVMCWLLKNLFDEIAVIVKINRSVTASKTHLDAWKTREVITAQEFHCQTVEILGKVDKFFRVYIFGYYVSNIPLFCFIYSNLIFGDLGSTTRLLLFWWGFLCPTSLLFVSVIAAAVSTAAHQAYNDVYALSLKPMPLDIHLKANMFVQRLGGPAIGLTCLDLFVVTKGALLSIASAIATYFVILVQFVSSSRNGTTCNVTSS